MGFKVDIDSTGRDFFFAPSGDNAFSGRTIQNSVADPTTAILRVQDLDPPPSAFQPASISAVVSGTYFDGIVTPDDTTISCQFASIVTSDLINVDIGNNQSVLWGALVNTVTDGVNCMIDGKTRVTLLVNALVVGLDGVIPTFDNIGVKVSGACEDIFVEIRQIALSGERAIGLEHTATTSTPIIYKIEKAEFFNVDQTMVRLENGLTERIEVEVDAVRRATSAIQPTTNSIIFDAVSGQINVRAQSLDADIVGRVGDGAQLGLTANICIGEIQIQDGGECLLRTGVLNGPITVDAGGRLECIINVQVGTITNNGTINGIINGIPYGNWRQKHQENVVLNASDFTTQNPAGTDSLTQITFGGAQFGPTDPVEIDASGNITINESDQYNVDVVFEPGRTGAAGSFVLMFFRVMINGAQFGDSRSMQIDNPNTANPIQFSSALDLLATDVLTFEFWRDSAGFDAGSLLSKVPTLGGTNPAPSSTVSMTRNRLVSES